MIFCTWGRLEPAFGGNRRRFFFPAGQYHNHHNHHNHHQAYDSSTRFLICVTVMFQNPADGFCADRALGSSGSAKRRRERRLRAMLRHERQTVAMPLAEKLNHGPSLMIWHLFILKGV